MIYSIEEIRKRVKPIAEKYALSEIVLFGSYARGEADDNSDIDLLVCPDSSGFKSGFEEGGLYHDLEGSFLSQVDMITDKALYNSLYSEINSTLKKNIEGQGVTIYG